MFRMIAVILIGLNFCPRALARNVVAEKVNSFGVVGEEAALVDELLKQALRRSSRIRKPLNAPDYEKLKPSLIKIGEEYIFSLEALSGTETVFHEKLRAESIADLEAVINRVVLSIARNQPIVDETDLDTTPDATIAGLKKRSFGSQFYFGLGPVVAANLKNSNMFSNLEAGLFSRVGNRAILKASLGYSWANHGDGSLFHLGLGSTYLLSGQANTPFVGAELFFGVVTRGIEIPNRVTNSYYYSYSSTETISGIGIGLNAGYLFFRTSSSQLELSASIRFLTSHFSNQYPVFGGIHLSFVTP